MRVVEDHLEIEDLGDVAGGFGGDAGDDWGVVAVGYGGEGFEGGIGIGFGGFGFGLGVLVELGGGETGDGEELGFLPFVSVGRRRGWVEERTLLNWKLS